VKSIVSNVIFNDALALRPFIRRPGPISHFKLCNGHIHTLHWHAPILVDNITHYAQIDVCNTNRIYQSDLEKPIKHCVFIYNKIVHWRSKTVNLYYQSPVQQLLHSKTRCIMYKGFGCNTILASGRTLLLQGFSVIRCCGYDLPPNGLRQYF